MRISAHTGGTNVSLMFPELLVAVIGKEGALLLDFSGILASRGEVPSPRIETTEIHERPDHILEAKVVTVLYDASAKVPRTSER